MTSDHQPSTRVVGEPPWFPVLAEVMDPAPELLDQLATEFAPIAASIDPGAYWTIFHSFAVDQLVGAALGDADDPAPIRSAAWVLYATSYWTGLSWTQVGVTEEAVGLSELDTAPSSVTEESVAPLARPIAVAMAALEGDLDDVLGHVATILREPAQTGALFGTAYNAGYMVVIGEAPPVGDRPAHLTFEPGYFRASPDAFLDLVYAEPAPEWLDRRRESYARANDEDPERLANIIRGSDTEVDLHDLWRDAYGQGVHNWGGDSLASWTQEFFEPFYRWSTVYSFGLEAISLASLVALTLDDEGAARDAITGNLLYACSWGGVLPGALDATGQLPKVVSS